MKKSAPAQFFDHLVGRLRAMAQTLPAFFIGAGFLT